MFDVAETIQRLCNEGTLDLGSIPSSMPESVQPSVSPDIPSEKVAVNCEPSVNRLPSLDLLSKTYLQTLVNHISNGSGRSIGLTIASKSGRVVQSAQTGWDASVFRTQQKALSKIARESVWQPQPRISGGALVSPAAPNPAATAGVAPEANIPADSLANDFDSNQAEHISEATLPDGSSPAQSFGGSVLLNEFANAIGTPLFMLPLALEKSSGYALFFFDASDCPSVGLPNYLASAGQLWSDKELVSDIAKQLDTWLVVQRCDWVMRAVAAVDWVRSHPRWWLTPVVLLCGSLFAPVPYYPRRECVFEPESKQFLASPVAGRIASCAVRPGDSVEAGQLLAQLDDDQLRRDLATAKAEYDGALKKRDAALATRAAGTAGLADIEMKQAQWRIESIEDHLRQLEIRATAPGIVVQGDWHRSIGMPVTLGQNLFEVAELESMIAEVRLNASDLGQINVGDEVHVRSDASGLETFQGKISRVEPRATIVDDAAVFIADVVIHDPSLKLRPGMKADAQITAGWRTLGWLLFERPYRWIANQWIW